LAITGLKKQQRTGRQRGS